MSNTATLLDTIPSNAGGNPPVYEYQIVIDTIDTDLIVRSPKSGRRIWVVGAWASETSAANITFKSGSSKSKVLELAANQGIWDEVGHKWIFCTKADEDLIIRSSVAFSDLTLYVVEGAAFDLNGHRQSFSRGA